MIYLSAYDSPCGEMTLASDGVYLTGLWFHGQKYYAAKIADETTVVQDNLAVFTVTKNYLDAYFTGNGETAKKPPVKVEGTPFFLTVSDLLQAIPYGTKITYGELAEKAALILGKDRMSAQAVGWAVGHNPVSVIIPCHRVLGADGSLTGYAGGTELKKYLLRLEKIPFIE